MIIGIITYVVECFSMRRLLNASSLASLVQCSGSNEVEEAEVGEAEVGWAEVGWAEVGWAEVGWTGWKYLGRAR